MARVSQLSSPVGLQLTAGKSFSSTLSIVYGHRLERFQALGAHFFQAHKAALVIYRNFNRLRPVSQPGHLALGKLASGNHCLFLRLSQTAFTSTARSGSKFARRLNLGDCSHAWVLKRGFRVCCRAAAVGETLSCSSLAYGTNSSIRLLVAFATPSIVVPTSRSYPRSTILDTPSKGFHHSDVSGHRLSIIQPHLNLFGFIFTPRLFSRVNL